MQYASYINDFLGEHLERPSGVLMRPGVVGVGLGLLERRRSWRTLWRWRDEPVALVVGEDFIEKPNGEWFTFQARVRVVNGVTEVDYISGQTERPVAS